MKTPAILFLIFVCNAFSQNVQWAAKVVSFSSDLGGKQFGIKQILGKPNAFPQCESSPTAWMPKSALSGAQVLEVEFEKEQVVKQIAVFENLNSGCVKVISVAGSDNKYKEVWRWTADWRYQPFKQRLKTDRAFYFNRKRRKVEVAPTVDGFPGIHRVILNEAVASVKKVRIKFDFSILPGQKQIDAIGISDSEVPIEAKIHAISETAIQVKPQALLSNCNSVACSPDGSQIFFSANNDGKNLVYSATNANFSEAKVLSDFTVNGTYNFIQGGAGSYYLYGGAPFSSAKAETGWQLVQFENGVLKKQSNLAIAAYSNYHETADATIATDAQIVILALESDLTLGGSDLYLARRKEDGTYSYLENLGKQINTAADEIAPFLCADNSTLFFASTGYAGFGGMDLYVSRRLDDTFTRWSEPLNLGRLVNTAANEVGMALSSKLQLFFIRQGENESELYQTEITSLATFLEHHNNKE